MAAGGEDDLLCDFAETYHILDWRGLPLPLAATLASGLPEDSRCRRRLSGRRLSRTEELLATIADYTALLLWRHCKPGTDKPVSILDQLTGAREEKPRATVFRSGADFTRAYERFIDKGG